MCEAHALPPLNPRRSWLALALVLLLALCLRLPTFVLPHNHGDQLQYLALAMKLDSFGFSGYQLRGVHIVESEDGRRIGAMAAAPGTRGTFLATLPRFYDVPLFHKPPLFPYGLAASHRLFAPEAPYLAVNCDLESGAWRESPWDLVKTQVYAVVVPLVFSLLTIFATFLLGRELAGPRVGLLAALILSLSPIELLVAQRLLTDTMLCFWVTVALFLFWQAAQHERMAWAVAGGLCAGLAALTKPTGAAVLLVVLAYTLGCRRAAWRQALVFCLLGVLLYAPWQWQIYKTYGVVVFNPAAEQADLMHNPWHAFVMQRPGYMYAANTVVQMPLLALAAWPLAQLARRESAGRIGCSREAGVYLLLWVIACPTLFLFVPVGKELRYLLPAYPALSLLAAAALLQTGRILRQRLGPRPARLLLGLVVGVAAGWSVFVGLRFALSGALAIELPF